MTKVAADGDRLGITYRAPTVDAPGSGGGGLGETLPENDSSCMPRGNYRQVIGFPKRQYCSGGWTRHVGRGQHICI